MDRLTWKQVGRGLLWTLVLAAGAVAFRRTFGHGTLARVVDVLRSADLGMLAVLGTPVLVAGFLLRAARFRALIRFDNGHRAPLAYVLASVVISQGANNVLPLRAGELVRTRDLVARGVPLRRVAFAQVIEKAIEFISLLAWVVLGARPLLSRVHPAVLGVLGVVALFAFGSWLIRVTLRRRSSGGFAEYRERLVSLTVALFWSLLADAGESALIALCLASLGVIPTLPMVVTVLASVNVAISLPSTPGQVGTFEAGATVGLLLAGLPSDVAVGFALVYRLVQWLPVTIAAGVLWLLRSSHRVNSHPGALQDGRA